MKINFLRSFLAVFLLCASAGQVSASYSLLWDDYDQGAGVVTARSNPSNALHTTGTADDSDSPTISGSQFLSLGLSGSVVLYLANNKAIANISGNDFTVFETTGGADASGYNPDTYPEYANVYAFTGGLYDPDTDYAASFWKDLGTILQNGSLELGSLAWTTAIKIMDATTTGGPSTDGFDVYGLGVSQVTTVPVPAAVWMLGSGLVFLVGVRRRMV